MPYDFLVKFTPQEVWIKGKGTFLWLAFFFSEIGAGIYLVSLFLNLRAGLLLGWLITLVIGGGLHLLYLGKPSRILLMFLKPVQSELSRGLWVILVFAVLGFIQLVPVVLPNLPWTGSNMVIKIMTGIICALIIIHGFLTMSGIRAIPVWNSAMMVPLSMASGLWVGSQIVVLLFYFVGINIGLPEIWARWSLLCFIVLLSLFILGAIQSSTPAQVSIKRMLTGEWSGPFYVGVVVIGILIPLIITIIAWKGDISKINIGILFLRCICVLVGDLMFRYGIMRNAVYSPLI
jgi:formate-dependent nitrite reductase membrane component NrfD